MEKENPEFKFGSIAFKMEMEYLMFLHSIWSGDLRVFDFYLNHLSKQPG